MDEPYRDRREGDDRIGSGPSPSEPVNGGGERGEREREDDRSRPRRDGSWDEGLQPCGRKEDNGSHCNRDTFIDALAGLERLTDPEAVRAWLVTVAVRRTRRTLGRRRRRALFLVWIADYAPRASDPRDRQPADELYDALSRIPEDLRIPWALHRVEQMSLPETAAVCEVSLATVKRRIAEAEERLVRRLGDRFEGATR